LNQNTEDIYRTVTNVEEEFIEYVKLLLNSGNRSNSRLEDSATEIEKLIEKLEAYNDKLD